MSARILVVDDNAANLDLVLYLLRAFGHEADGFGDAFAAFEAARRETYALILTDILMPGMDGFELVARLRGEPALAATPVVAVTALAMAGDRERIAAAGFDGYITKPIDPQSFVSQVDGFLSSGSNG